VDIAPHDELAAQVVVLKKLQTDGVISSEEFENKKAELLGRMRGSSGATLRQQPRKEVCDYYIESS